MSDDTRPHVILMVTAEITARLFVAGYAEYLARNGFRVTLMADDLSAIEHEMGRRGVATRSLPMRRDPNLWRDLISLRRMWSLVRSERPDAVMYATPKASLLGSIVSKALHVPVRIYGLWGLRFETERGPKRSVLRLLERVTASASTKVLANSPSLAAEAERSGIARPGKVTVLGSGSSHGVDVHRFAPDAEVPNLDDATKDFLQRGDGPVVGFVGRLHPDKGVDTLLEAASRLRREGSPARFLLVGSDEGALEVSGHDEEGRWNVHFVGSAEDVRPYLCSIDVLVLMSRREGFPNAVLEAAAMGVPAVVADSTGTIDSVVDEVTGLILPTGDSHRLADALVRLLEDPGARERMGRSARARVAAEFSQDHVWALHADHLRRSLGGRTRVISSRQHAARQPHILKGQDT